MKARQNLSSSTLVNLLRWRSNHNPELRSYTFLLEGDEPGDSLSCYDLDQRARAIAAMLQSVIARGDRVLLLFPPGLEFVTGFFGCLYAGAIAVPTQLPPSRPKRTHNWQRFESIATHSRPSAVLTTTRLLEIKDGLNECVPLLKSARWIGIDGVPWPLAEEWKDPNLLPGSVAFLQYTSGSTAMPKGVMVTHENLLYNLEYINIGFQHSVESVGLSWLPHFHDMGLIDGLLEPVYAGFPSYLMSPLALLQNPGRWLAAISRFRVSHSGGPNFAYDLCVRKVSAEQRGTLDLSCWDVAYNGAEPIRARTLHEFVKAFGPSGFRLKSFYPAYGLAEATLKVSGGTRGNGPIFLNVDGPALENHRVAEVAADKDGARTLVGSGAVSIGTSVVIVNPDSLTLCSDGEVGEIWTSGPGVASGYWERPLETEETFRAYVTETREGPFLRTGDLGFLTNNELFVTGRLKDLIIIRGLNHYPQDIETTVQESHAALRPGGTAAFSIEVSGSEELVVVQEVDSRKIAEFDPVIRAIQQSLLEHHEIQVYALVLVKPGEVPKTTSGKLQRRACREMYLNGGLDVIQQWVRPSAHESDAGIPSPPDGPLTEEAAIEWLRSCLAVRLRISSDDIDVDRPITRYGLDSLLAMQLMHDIEAALGLGLSVSELLRSPTVKGLAARVAERGALPSVLDPIGAGPVPGENQLYPLSAGQQSLWFLHELDPTSPAYNIACAVLVVSPLDLDALRDSFATLVRRHGSLRTTFVGVNGQPMQRLSEDFEICFESEDASEWDTQDLNHRLAVESNQPFDLEKGPLIKMQTYTRSDQEHIVLLVAHHMVADLWSMAIVLRELCELYSSGLDGTEARLASCDVQYVDYVGWQSRLLENEAGERLRCYWQQQLSGAPTAIDFPSDRPRPAVETHRGASRSFAILSDLALPLRAMATQAGATLYMALLAAYAVVINRYTGQTDIVVGSPAAGRGRRELAGLVGYLANPLVMRVRLEDDPSFRVALDRIRETVLTAFEHELFPFPEVVKSLHPDRDPSRSPVFQLFFAFQKAQLPDGLTIGPFALGMPGGRMKVGKLTVESMSAQRSGSQFDMSLLLAELDEGLGGLVEYNTDLFDQTTIDRVAGHFKVLIASIVACPGRSISTLQLMAPAEIEQMLVDWNRTEVAYSTYDSLVPLIDAQARKSADAIALVSGTHQITMRELHSRADRVAALLVSEGIGPDMVVGVLVERAPEMVIALLGILKAGAAFLPLDPAFPAERILFMASNARAPIILTQQRSARLVQGKGLKVICLDEASAWDGAAELIRPPAITSDNLAYVIYTSGSTGEPKGAMNTHGAILNRLLWMQREYSLDGSDCVLQKTPFIFDVSVWEFFWPVMTGAKLLMARPDGHQDVPYLVRLIREQQVTTLHFVPSMLRAFLENPETGACRCIRRVISSGEELGVELEQIFFERLGAELDNLYGPTEAAVDVTSWQCVGGSAKHRIPIGKPISNIQTYAVDQEIRPVPIGVAGELLIGGAGLARGYAGRPDMTAERFVPNSFGSEPGARLYRTGDLARYLPAGDIEFLGRIDHQVKVRGFRIELAEVEAALDTHPAIGKAIVIARKDSVAGSSLIAYVVPKSLGNGTADSELSPGDLRGYLSARLPRYMIPDSYVLLTHVPLTSTGKVDRRSLPPPDSMRPESGRGYQPPATELEKAVARIFQEVLGLNKVGVNDSFFDLGGHSLLATQALSRIRDRLNVEISLGRLFEDPTISGIVRTIGSGEGCDARVSSPIPRISPPVEELISRLDRLSDEQVATLLQDATGEEGME